MLTLRLVIPGALALSTLNGCSLLGLGIGAATPKYVDVAPERLSVGDSVVAHAVSSKNAEEELPDVRGRFVKSEPEFIVIESGGENTRVPRSKIDHVSTQRGSYWVTGLLVGAALEVAFVAAVAGMSGLRWQQ